MNDFGFHMLLFAISGAVIVVIASMFSSPSDEEALRSLPKRLLYFAVGCGLVAGIMLICEHTLARAS